MGGSRLRGRKGGGDECGMTRGLEPGGGERGKEFGCHDVCISELYLYCTCVLTLLCFCILYCVCTI